MTKQISFNVKNKGKEILKYTTPITSKSLQSLGLEEVSQFDVCVCPFANFGHFLSAFILNDIMQDALTR